MIVRLDGVSIQHWRLAPGQLLNYRQWGDECVLFNDLSGHTHLLDSCALNLLLELLGGVKSIDFLEASLQRAMKDRGQVEQKLLLCDLLETLEAISLVEQCQP